MEPVNSITGSSFTGDHRAEERRPQGRRNGGRSKNTEKRITEMNYMKARRQLKEKQRERFGVSWVRVYAPFWEGEG